MISEAAATLISAVVAVAGAVVIAWRQTKIASRQNEVLAGQNEVLKTQIEVQRAQVNLEAAALRADLFERRMTIFNAATRLVRGLNGSTDEDAASERREQFLIAMDESQFLFRPEVYAELKKFDHMSYMHLRAMRGMNAKAPHPDGGSHLWGNEFELYMGQSYGARDALAPLFAPDLRVGGYDPMLPDPKGASSPPQQQQ